MEQECIAQQKTYEEFLEEAAPILKEKYSMVIQRKNALENSKFKLATYIKNKINEGMKFGVSMKQILRDLSNHAGIPRNSLKLYYYTDNFLEGVEEVSQLTLPFTSYQELATAGGLEDEQKEQILKEAEAKSLFKEKIRKKIVEVKQEIKLKEELARKADLKSQGIKTVELNYYNLWDIDLTTVPVRDIEYEAGSNKFHGNCTARIIEQCIERYTKIGDLVLDSMAGSGTTIDVCKAMGRKCLAFDINTYLYRKDIAKGNALNLGFDAETIDFIFNHIPYHDMVDYSKYNPKKIKEADDLSLMSADKFLEAIEKLFEHNARILKKGGYFCVLVGDKREKGLVDLPAKVSNIGSQFFKLHDKAYKPVINQRCHNNKDVIAGAKKHNFMIPMVDTLLVFQKS